MPVVLLVHCDGTNGSTAFTDVSPSAHPLTATNTTVNTTSPKFGSGAGSFGGTSNITVGAPQTDFNFGAGQFTMEAWARFTSAPGSGNASVLTQWSGSTNLGWCFRMNAGALTFFYSTTGTDVPSVAAAFTPTLNTWYHLAVDRDTSNVLRVYIDGAVVASATVAASFFNSTLAAVIGNDGGGIRGLGGHIDEVRIVKGTAMYGGPFTPPTTPFLPADPASVARATQVISEQWIMPNANAQATSVFMEMWAPGGTTTPRAVATLVALEQWASAGLAVTQQQARAWIMA